MGNEASDPALIAERLDAPRAGELVTIWVCVDAAARSTDGLQITASTALAAVDVSELDGEQRSVLAELLGGGNDATKRGVLDVDDDDDDDTIRAADRGDAKARSYRDISDPMRVRSLDTAGVAAAIDVLVAWHEDRVWDREQDADDQVDMEIRAAAWELYFLGMTEDGELREGTGHFWGIRI